MLIAGAGMAGLVCAARARELGLRPAVVERGNRPGGSMLLSSGVIWRHREWGDFRSECPGGDEHLQRLGLRRIGDVARADRSYLEAQLAYVRSQGVKNFQVLADLAHRHARPWWDFYGGKEKLQDHLEGWYVGY